MKIDYLTKVGAAVTAFFAPTSDGRIGERATPTDLAPIKSVAIIGAGAGGASTAYYLSQFLEPPHLAYKHHHVSITIFEQSDKIGGRTTVFRVKNSPPTSSSSSSSSSLPLDKDDTTSSPPPPPTPPRKEEFFVEVGASIFVNVNYNLVEATKAFGLETKVLKDEKVAIWDGQEIIFEESSSKFWSIVKGLKRWGFAPLKLQRIVKKNIENLLESYTSPESFESIAEFAKRFRLSDIAAESAENFLTKQGIGKRYSQEIVEVATRVNYGSNLNEIHALGALVTMAADDALQIEGGNFQIFEGMVCKSQADVRLNTKIVRVRALEPEYEGAEPQFEVVTASGQKQVFDHIVIAAPIQSTDIDFDLNLPPLPKVNYRTIHTTFVRGRVNPVYFGRDAVSSSQGPTHALFPTHILTTHSDNVEFTSLSVQVNLDNGETVTKIFSAKPLENELLDRLYSNRTWVKRKVWKAYPKLEPVSAIVADGLLDKESDDAESELVNEQQQESADGGEKKKPSFLSASEIRQYVLQRHHKHEKPTKAAATTTATTARKARAAWGQVEVVPGVFYLNAFEPLISTMETETISGKNIARLLRDKILGYCPVEKK
ncbi:hypothetical protein BGZ94_001524 [Podila epigama]|nr:hypothetical protein BGZ94_001524 [Podila epigama]